VSFVRGLWLSVRGHCPSSVQGRSVPAVFSIKSRSSRRTRSRLSTRWRTPGRWPSMRGSGCGSDKHRDLFGDCLGAFGRPAQMGPPSSPGRIRAELALAIRIRMYLVHFSARRWPTTQGEWGEVAVIISPFAQDLLHHLDSIEWRPIHRLVAGSARPRDHCPASSSSMIFPNQGETLPAS
jgi:hypothetical protein